MLRPCTPIAVLVCNLGCGAALPWNTQPATQVDNGLAAFSGTCIFTVASGRLALDFPAGGDLGVLARRPADNVITVNDAPCTSTDTVPANATSANVRTVVVTGGSGDDTFILDFTTGAFSPGRGATPGVTVDLGAGSNAFKFRGTAAADTVTVGALGISLGANMDITVANTSNQEPTYEFALGTGNDVFNSGGSTITGSASMHDFVVFGGLGNDTFNDGASKNGNSEFHGGVGLDTVSYASRTLALAITVDGVTGCGEPGEADLIVDDVEVVVGGSGDDVFAVTALADPLATLTLNGGPGNDRFVEPASATPNTVFVGGLGLDTVDYSARVLPLTITVASGANDGQANEKDDVQSSIEKVIGGQGNDAITGGPGNDILCGGPGNDVLNGGAGDDIFLALDDTGADTYVGGAGVDTVDYSGRVANLTVDMVGTAAAPDADDGEGGEHDDVRNDVENLLGGDGDDTLTGNTLNNVISGGAGNDTLQGGAGDDTLEGGPASGPQHINCGVGDDIALSTSPGNDVVNPDCEL